MPRRTPTVTRWSETFVPNRRRVITRLFTPGDDRRTRAIIARIMSLSEEQAEAALADLKRDFGHRHRDIEASWRHNFGEIEGFLDGLPVSPARQLLIGAHFTMEYAIEAAALFNPSMVPAPDQGGLPSGAVRFIMSLRATGEGHVSSIVFRTGVISAEGDIRFDPPSGFTRGLKPLLDHPYDKPTFFLKLIETGGFSDEAQAILDRLPEEFTYRDLQRVVAEDRPTGADPEAHARAADVLLRLARSNYLLWLEPGLDPAEVVIFPVADSEKAGIEDMRLVRFTEDDGSVWYYGTYTAYDGMRIMPQLMETRAFEYIGMTTLRGIYARNKGLALFPRRVGGWYLMVSRLDGESMYLMHSHSVRFWNDAVRLQEPRFPWEFFQIGNCGSPIETPAGWLLLTHGVGPMRRYSIGVSLLDLHDPSRVIGQLRDPLIVPTEEERDGYVPNVVYSCGALLHGDRLIIPYAMADSTTSIAFVSVSEILSCMKPPG